MTPWG